MNILFIRPLVENGGATIYMLQLAEGLFARGHKIVVATCGGEQKGQLARYGALYDQIWLSPSTPVNWVASLAAIMRIGRREKIDIINSHHRFAALVGKAAARLTGIPFVSTIHEFKENRGQLTRLGFGDTVITTSSAVRQHVITHFCTPAEKAFAISMGVEIPAPLPAQQRAALLAELGLDHQAPIIACIGRLSPEKGQVYLLQAIPDVLASFPKAQFLFVGDGPDRAELEALAVRLGLTERAFFLGWRNDVQGLIGLADFLVAPSVFEGLGIAILEGFAQKKGVIATNVGGIPEIVKPQETGMLVPACNSKALSEAVISLLKNPAQASVFGQNGYKLVTSHFSKQQMVQQTETLFQRLIEKRM